MAKLKLGALEDDKPVKLSLVFPAALYRDLIAYAEILGRESGKAVDPAKLIAPMVERFMATDREFAKLRHAARSRSQPADSVPPRGE